RRIVERGQVEQTSDLLLHLLGDKRRLLEALAAMYDPMANRIDLGDLRQYAVLAVSQHIYNFTNRFIVIENFTDAIHFHAARRLMRQDRIVHSDTLDAADRKHGFMLHVVELIF